MQLTLVNLQSEVEELQDTLLQQRVELDILREQVSALQSTVRALTQGPRRVVPASPNIETCFQGQVDRPTES